jgi:AcrR family transcriptional regulator
MLMHRSQQDRRLATTRALLVAGRRLFGAYGYGEVTSASLAAAARVTTGAMYHHFEGKAALFRAVFEAVEADLADTVTRAAAGPRDPLRKLELGALAFLDAARERSVRQIVLVDGPTVLGWDRWRELDARYHLRPLKGALIAAMRAHLVERRDPETLARLVMGALTEAALDGSREMAASTVWLVRRLRT